MGQGLWCCECIYWNVFASCVGLSANCLLCSCWLCPPEPIRQLRGNQCCKCGWPQGCGHSLFCISHIFLIPNWLRDFSIYESIGDIRKQIYDVNIVSSPLGNPYIGATY